MKRRPRFDLGSTTEGETVLFAPKITEFPSGADTKCISPLHKVRQTVTVTNLSAAVQRYVMWSKVDQALNYEETDQPDVWVEDEVLQPFTPKEQGFPQNVREHSKPLRHETGDLHVDMHSISIAFSHGEPEEYAHPYRDPYFISLRCEQA